MLKKALTDQSKNKSKSISHISFICRKWCGDSRPPALTSAAPMLVGYMALVPGSQGASGDRFR